MVSDNPKYASVEAVKVIAVISGENMISRSVTGISEVQVDDDLDPHSKIKQTQPIKKTVNTGDE